MKKIITGEFTFSIVEENEINIERLEEEYPFEYSENMCFIKAHCSKKGRITFEHIANFLIDAFLEQNIEFDKFDSVVIDLTNASHYILVDSYAFIMSKNRETIFKQIISDLTQHFPLW